MDQEPNNPSIARPIGDLISEALFPPLTESKPTSPAEKLPDKLLERLWLKMTELYGHRWTSSFGASADPASAWASALRGINGRQIAHGLNMLVALTYKWPPSAPEFRGLCLNLQPEAIGLPDIESAFHQALAGRYRHLVVKAAAAATGLYDLHRGELTDESLRKRFAFQYLTMARRYANGEPLDAPVVCALEHDLGRSIRELADEFAERKMRERLERQGLVDVTAVQARNQLLDSLRIHREVRAV